MKVTFSDSYLSGFSLPTMPQVVGPIKSIAVNSLPSGTTLVTSMEKEVFDKVQPVLQMATAPLLRVSTPLITAAKIAVPQVLKLRTKMIDVAAPQTIQQFKPSDEVEKKSAIEEAMSLIPLGGLAMFAFIL